VNVVALASGAIQATPKITVNAESSGHADSIRAGSFGLTENDRNWPNWQSRAGQPPDFSPLGPGTGLAIVRERVAEQDSAT
jgi:hypothetical protein